MDIICIDGEIGWDITAAEVINKLKDASGDIEVHVNSVGGSVYQGVSIFNALFSYNKGQITTVNKGMAASMASYIMLVGDKIKSYSNATFMIHNALTFAYGNADDLRKTANHLESLSNIIANKYVDKTGKSMEEVKQMMDDETFLYGTEMHEHGFVDEMVSVEKKMPKETAVMSLQNEFKACLASSKAHCKIEGYNGDIEPILNTLVSIPTEQTADKLENSNTGVDMSISKEEVDSLVAKAVEISNQETIKSLKEANAKLADLETFVNKTEVLAFCGANRNVISMKQEQEFLDAEATLSEVMSFAMAGMENTPAENINGEVEEPTEMSKMIANAVEKQNKGAM